MAASQPMKIKIKDLIKILSENFDENEKIIFSNVTSNTIYVDCIDDHAEILLRREDGESPVVYKIQHAFSNRGFDEYRSIDE